VLCGLAVAVRSRGCSAVSRLQLRLRLRFRGRGFRGCDAVQCGATRCSAVRRDAVRFRCGSAVRFPCGGCGGRQLRGRRGRAVAVRFAVRCDLAACDAVRCDHGGHEARSSAGNAARSGGPTDLGDRRGKPGRRGTRGLRMRSRGCAAAVPCCVVSRVRCWAVAVLCDLRCRSAAALSRCDPTGPGAYQTGPLGAMPCGRGLSLRLRRCWGVPPCCGSRLESAVAMPFGIAVQWMNACNDVILGRAVAVRFRGCGAVPRFTEFPGVRASGACAREPVARSSASGFMPRATYDRAAA
jgi:hypothetical protein